MFDLPDVLLHYCSLETAIAILKHRAFRLSSIFHLNDGLEYKWLQNQAYILLTTIPDPLIDPDLVFAKPTQTPYCFCMSTKSDSLSQWRAYSQDGYGVALGIDPRSFGFQREGDVWHRFGDKYPMELAPIEYNHKRQMSLIEDCIRRAKVGIRAMDAAETPKQQTSEALRLILAEVSARCKNPAFEEEEEWRLIYRHNEKPLAGNTPASPSALGVRVTGTTLVPYYEYSFDPHQKITPPIVGVRLGPKVSYETKTTLEMYLKEQGYFNVPNFQIVESHASYRTL